MAKELFWNVKLYWYVSRGVYKNLYEAGVHIAKDTVPGTASTAMQAIQLCAEWRGVNLDEVIEIDVRLQNARGDRPR